MFTTVMELRSATPALLRQPLTAWEPGRQLYPLNCSGLRRLQNDVLVLEGRTEYALELGGKGLDCVPGVLNTSYVACVAAILDSLPTGLAHTLSTALQFGSVCERHRQLASSPKEDG
jgi:hypothetical protein